MQRTDKIFQKENTMGIIEQLAEIRHQEGIEEGLEKAIRSLLTKHEFSIQKIAELLDVPLSLVEKVKKELDR
jgi:hypothetical protein